MARRLIPASDHPTAAAEVAGWLVAEWAHLYPDWDLTAATDELLAVGPGGEPPITWLLFDDDSDPGTEEQHAGMRVIGSIGLALDGELGEPLDGTASRSGVWVVNLFVTPSARGRGHGSVLLDHAVEHARGIATPDLLLTTEHSVAHYRSKGWTEIGTTSLNGHRCAVMTVSTVTR